MPTVYKRKRTYSNGEEKFSTTYYFKAKASNGKRTDINTKQKNKKDAITFMKKWFSSSNTIEGEIQIKKIKSTETIVDVLDKQGWLNPGRNPKYIKSKLENSNYGILQAKKIANAFNNIFNPLNNLDDFFSFINSKKILRNSSIDYYINFTTKPFKELTYDDTNKFIEFIYEYTEWEKKNRWNKNNEYFISNKAINIIAFKAFFSYSFENGISPINLFSTIRIPRNHNFTPKPIFSAEHLKVIFNDDFAEYIEKGFSKSSLYRAYKFSALTGMRSGEIRALRWKQISEDNHTLVIDSAFKIDATQKVAIGLPKWNKIRTIVLCDSAIKCLGKREGNDDFVFQLKSGNAIGNNRYSKKFISYIDDIENQFKNKNLSFTSGNRFTPHCLRGTLNSILISGGNLNESIIQEYLGWTKTTLTQVQLTHYTKFDEKSMYKVADEIELMFSGNRLDWNIKDTNKSNDKLLESLTEIMSGEKEHSFIPNLNEPSDTFEPFKHSKDFIPKLIGEE